MKDALGLITGWLNNITDVLKALIALGVAIGILFNDPFNVIAGIGSLMSQFGDAGIAGLIALILIIIQKYGLIPKITFPQPNLGFGRIVDKISYVRRIIMIQPLI